MVNDCLQIALKDGRHPITSMKSLSLMAYHQLDSYGIATYYRLSAISKAAGMVSGYRKSLKKNPNTMRPYARRLSLTDCYGFKIEGGNLRITIRKGEYESIRLHKHTMEVISNPSYKLRSVSLTGRVVSVAFSKETGGEVIPKGAMGIDSNLLNVTVADSHDNVKRFDLSGVAEIKARCRETKKHFRRNDIRMRRQIFGKYGNIQRNRVQWILHNISASIVKEAKLNQFAIVMENLKGIRKLYHKRSGQGNEYHSTMNSWSFYQLQKQIEYKAQWEGLPVIYVDPRGTSVKCAKCGCKTMRDPNAYRALVCPKCGVSFDRDENAAKNILAKGGVRFTPNEPSEERKEAMKGNAEHEGEPQILGVDEGKLRHAERTR